MKEAFAFFVLNAAVAVRFIVIFPLAHAWFNLL